MILVKLIMAGYKTGLTSSNIRRESHCIVLNQFIKVNIELMRVLAVPSLSHSE